MLMWLFNSHYPIIVILSVRKIQVCYEWSENCRKLKVYIYSLSLIWAFAPPYYHIVNWWVIFMIFVWIILTTSPASCIPKVIRCVLLLSYLIENSINDLLSNSTRCHAVIFRYRQRFAQCRLDVGSPPPTLAPHKIWKNNTADTMFVKRWSSYKHKWCIMVQCRGKVWLVLMAI